MHHYVWEKKHGKIPDGCVYIIKTKTKRTISSQPSNTQKDRHEQKFNPKGNNQYTQKNPYNFLFYNTML